MIGTRLANRYEIVRELGRGGMGVVYLAHDPLLDREVAVKLVPPTALSIETEERLRHEARLVARLDHPAIVIVHDIGTHEGSLFLVMPYVAGHNLQTLLAEKSLRLGDVLEIGSQVAEALDYSHSVGIVHRDIKPENLLVARLPSEGLRVRITDFGLAIADHEQRLTRAGVAVGTVAYCSPEQVRAEEVDGRSDIYSLGTVLYQCLTGRTPFTGDVQAVLYRIVREKPEPLRTLAPEVDEELQEIVLACLEKEREKRPQRAREVAEALSRYRARLKEHERAKTLLLTTPTASIPFRAPSPSTFVGREKELTELQRRLNAALTAECQLVVVGGETGTGKSRLLDELEQLARARKIRVFHGRFVEQDRAFPYQGFCEIIQEYFRAKVPSGSSSNPDFSDLVPELVALFPVLGELWDVRASSTSEMRILTSGEFRAVVREKRPEDKTAVFELLARALMRVAGGKPMVVLLEDLHAADVSTEALSYIVRRLGPAPVLFVATYRTTEVGRHHPLAKLLDGFEGDRRFSQLELPPLSAAEHRQLVEAMTGSAQLDEGLISRLYEATEGNPYFARELVLSLLDAGALVKDPTGNLQLSSGEFLSIEALPKTIQQTVTRRIERLSKELSELLSVASVLGRSFELHDLARLSDGEAGKVEDAVERLVADGFLEEERATKSDRFAFASGVVRDVLYAGLPRRKRRQLHKKHAEELEQEHAGHLPRVYPQLLTHYAQGDAPEKVVEYGIKFARRSLAAASGEEASRALRTVLDALEEQEQPDPSVEGDARTLMAAALRTTGDADGALRELEKGWRLLAAAGRMPDAVKAHVQAAETAWEARRVEQARQWIDAGLEAARAAGETASLARLLALGATVANLRGEYERAREYLEESDRVAPVSQERAEELPRGGKLAVGLPVLVRAAEPAEFKLIEEAEILSNVFETLLATDARGNLVPRLCERWEALEGGRLFLLTLRAGARFSNGTPLTAAQVKASFERGIEKAQAALPGAFSAIRGVPEFLIGNAPGVEGIRVLGERELELMLAEPLPIYPALLTDPKTAIALATAVPAETAPLPGRTNEFPLGTGPFRVSARTADRVELSRNIHHAGSEPHVQAVEFRTGLVSSQLASGLRSGELDLARDLLPEDLDQIMRDRRLRPALVETPQKNVYFVLFSSRSEIARQLPVRRALTGVVRTHDLVRRTLGRFAQPAEGLFPPGILGHDPGRRRQPLSRERALALLEESGVERPFSLRAAVHPILQDRYASLLTGLFNVWADLGVDVSNETHTMTSYLERGERNEGIDLLVGRWIADYDDPDNFTWTLFRTRGGRFRNFYSTPDLNLMVEEARAESRPERREKTYRKVEEQLLQSHYFLPLFHDIDTRVANPRVKNLRLLSSPPYVNYASLAKAETGASRRARGALHIPISGDVRTLDPAGAFTVGHVEVISTLFETLARQTEGARIVPWLAESIAAEDGGRRFRLRLREDVRFHDGRRLSARDVRYTFERVLSNPEGRNRNILSPILGAGALLEGDRGDLDGLRILSAHELTIDLEQPVSFFPALLAHPATAIVPEGTDPMNDSWRERAIGTGPFRMVRFDPGRRLELEANHHYWRAGLPKGEVLTFSFGVPPADVLTGFKSGRFSLAWDLVPQDVETLRHDGELGRAYGETPQLSTYYVLFNAHSGQLADEGRRRELARCIDVDTLVRRHLGRLAIPAHSLIPPGLLGHEHDRVAETCEPPRSSAGHGLELYGIVHSVYEGTYSALAKDLFGAFRACGYRVRLPEDDPRSDGERALASASADFLMGRWIADYPDSDSFVSGLLHSQKGLFGPVAGTPELDHLIELGRAETDPEVRHDIYREIEELLRKRAVLLPLFHEQAYRFARPEVEGFEVTFASPIVAYERLSVAR